MRVAGLDAHPEPRIAPNEQTPAAVGSCRGWRCCFDRCSTGSETPGHVAQHCNSSVCMSNRSQFALRGMTSVSLASAAFLRGRRTRILRVKLCRSSAFRRDRAASRSLAVHRHSNRNRLPCALCLQLWLLPPSSADRHRLNRPEARVLRSTKVPASRPRTIPAGMVRGIPPWT
jgi:hypothetical protein